jgi:hypothetical protein
MKTKIKAYLGLLLGFAILTLSFTLLPAKQASGISFANVAMMRRGRRQMYRNPGQTGGFIINPTQLEKALSVAKKMGADADTAQFSETVLYDTLPLDGRTIFNFFKDVQKRSFPRTNLTENKLQKQENMIVKFISLEVLTFSVAGNDVVTSVDPLSAAFNGLYRSDMQFTIGQSQVLKYFALDGLNPSFNMFAKHTTSNIVRLGIDLTIPELLQFFATIQVPAYTAAPTKELMLKIHGQGTLFSPRMNF